MNAQTKLLVSILFPLAVLSGCASSPPLLPITNVDERIQFNGFSVLPPNGSNWNWVGREGQNKSEFFNTTFAKTDGDRTYLARAHLEDARNLDFDISDFEALIVYLKRSDAYKEGPRQENMMLEMATDNSIGISCVRFDLEAEDPRVPGSPGEVFKVDAHGLYCPHPFESKVLAHIAYTRRAPKGQPYVASRDEGERFVNSLEFTTVNR